MKDLTATTCDEVSSSVMDQARSRANKLMVNQISNKLKKSPTTNLAPFLRQQLAAYDRLVTTFASTESNESEHDSDTSPSIGGSKISTEKENLHRLYIHPTAEVIHPLHIDFFQAFVQCPQWQLSEEHPTAEVWEALVHSLNRAISEGEILWQLHSTFVLSITSTVVIKISSSLDLDEVSNLVYLNSVSAEFPVPVCLGALRSHQRTYLIMSRAQGRTLESVWPQLATRQKTSVQKQLTNIFHKLRSLPRTVSGNDAKIGSFLSGTCKDMRRLQRVSTQPICGEIEFNKFLTHEEGRTQTHWIQMIHSSMETNHAMVATHADLHPRNIMVEWESGKEGKILVTSIIDWALAGWYPEYWDFVKALNTDQLRGPLADWCEYLPKEAIGSWPTEFSLDLLISRWLG